jgi:hypothetical protein
MIPITGADGEDGTVRITASADAVDMQPAELATVNLKVPEGRAETIVLIPLPVVVMLPGVLVNVQVPVEGSPLNWTLPLAAEHDVGVTDPTIGADGVTGCGFMTTLPDEAEEQLLETVTVNVKVPELRAEIVVDVPLPGYVAPPGLTIIVQLSVGGNPLKSTLPVLEEQVVWVTIPNPGASGMAVIVTGVVAVTLPHPPDAAIV